MTGVTGILLAAGDGSRFGGGKLLHPLPDGGVPLALTSCRRLRQAIEQVCVVVRAGDDAVASLFRHEDVCIVICEDAVAGMGRSIACGVEAMADADGWVIALGDMPLVSLDTISSVAGAIGLGAPICVPVFAGQRGHPVGFGSRFLHELIALTGDIGAREVLRAHRDLVRELMVDDPGIHADIDTRADLERLAPD